MNKWLRLMRFDRPIGILLLLWPTVWALLIAGTGSPSLKNVIIFVSGVVLMRAAGCVINDYADRHFDPHVERTKSRPIAAGEIQPKHALILFTILLLLAFLLVLQTNALTIKLSFVAAALATCYPFCKRFTHLPQLVLGLAFAWSIPMVFAAETGHIPNTAWWLLVINTIWTLVYDTEYAMADREDDQHIGVKSSALLFAQKDRLIIGGLQLLILILTLLFSWLYLPILWPMTVATGLIGLLFLQQQQLIRHRQAEKCFQAFLQNNRVGFIFFIGLLLSYWLSAPLI